MKDSNCTKTKDILVKAVFDGKQSGRQAFVNLISRQYQKEQEQKKKLGMGNETVEKAGGKGKKTEKIVEETEQKIDKRQNRGYTVSCERKQGSSDSGFAENGGYYEV